MRVCLSRTYAKGSGQDLGAGLGKGGGVEPA